MNPHRFTLTILMLTALYHVAQLALMHYAHVPPAPGKPGAADSGVIWWIAKPSANEWREARGKILVSVETSREPDRSVTCDGGRVNSARRLTEGTGPAHHSISRQREGLGVTTPVNPGLRSVHRHALSGLLLDTTHTKPGLAATADGRIGREGYLITRQPGREPNRPFPRSIGSELARIWSPDDSSQTPAPLHSYKTRCSVPTRNRQVPSPPLLLLQPTDQPLCGPAGLLEMAADHARTNPSAWEICATKEHGYIDGDLPRRKNCDGCDSARARRALTWLRDCGESR
jgi:hypothetical protein